MGLLEQVAENLLLDENNVVVLVGVPQTEGRLHDLLGTLECQSSDVRPTVCKIVTVCV